jgi:hypothetical protein
MSQTIFQNVPLVNTSFFQKIFKQLPTENSVIELNNLLASHPVKEISKQQIYEIEQRYQITLEQEFKLNLEEFYAVYLNYCFTDKSFDSEDIGNLNHLKSILSLDENTIEKLNHKVGAIIYRKYFEKSVANGRLIKKEEDFLEKIEKNLKLPKALVEMISAEIIGNYVRNYAENLIKNQNLSPDEEKDFENIAISLNLDAQFNEKMRQQLKRLKLYWALENLSLPTIEPDIVIQKSEYCYFKINSVNWYELRSVRQKPAYYNSNSRILKDFYLKQNSYKSMNHSGDLKYIDKGSIYLTNKRIIFIGSTKNLNVRFEKILRLTPKSDGVEVDKETGKVAVIQLPDRVDEFCLILERLIRER